MSGKQKLPATDRISLAEARATGLLELWQPSVLATIHKRAGPLIQNAPTTTRQQIPS